MYRSWCLRKCELIVKIFCPTLFLLCICICPPALQAEPLLRVAGQSAPLSQPGFNAEERLLRRERMRAIRQALIEQRQVDEAAGKPALAPTMDHPPGQGFGRADGMGNGPGRGLRQLPPEERERLRREMREAVRERRRP